MDSRQLQPKITMSQLLKPEHLEGTPIFMKHMEISNLMQVNFKQYRLASTSELLCHLKLCIINTNSSSSIFLKPLAIQSRTWPLIIAHRLIVAQTISIRLLLLQNLAFSSLQHLDRQPLPLQNLWLYLLPHQAWMNGLSSPSTRTWKRIWGSKKNRNNLDLSSNRWSSNLTITLMWGRGQLCLKRTWIWCLTEGCLSTIGCNRRSKKKMGHKGR